MISSSIDFDVLVLYHAEYCILAGSFSFLHNLFFFLSQKIEKIDINNFSEPPDYLILGGAGATLATVL